MNSQNNGSIVYHFAFYFQVCFLITLYSVWQLDITCLISTVSVWLVKVQKSCFYCIAQHCNIFVAPALLLFKHPMFGIAIALDALFFACHCSKLWLLICYCFLGGIRHKIFIRTLKLLCASLYSHGCSISHLLPNAKGFVYLNKEVLVNRPIIQYHAPHTVSCTCSKLYLPMIYYLFNLLVEMVVIFSGKISISFFHFYSTINLIKHKFIFLRHI